MTIDFALTLLVAIPLVGAVAVAFLPATAAKAAGLGISALTLAWAVVFVLLPFEVGGGMQLTEEADWIKPLGVHYALGVDGLGLLMVLLTAVLVPIVLAASWWEADGDVVAAEDGSTARSCSPCSCSTGTRIGVRIRAANRQPSGRSWLRTTQR